MIYLYKTTTKSDKFTSFNKTKASFANFKHKCRIKYLK